MPSDTITLLVKFLPTILAGVLILLCMLRGLLRGFRKSLILFIHYIIAIAVGLVCYFQATKIVLSSDLNTILASLGSDFAEANSVYDAIGVFVKSYVPDFAGILENQYIEQFVMAIVGLAVSLVLGIVCLFVIPLVVRIILRLLYLLFYREGKIKKHKKAEGEKYNPRRLLGMAVGAVRGVVWATVTVCFLTSTYFILSGGITPTEKETEEIQLLDYLSDSIGFDLNAVYKGLKESRSTGIGMVFDAIKIEGTPIDLYYSDLFLSSTFTYYPAEEDEVTGLSAYLSSDEVVQGELAKLCIREELTLLVGLVESILETNAVTIDGEQVYVEYDKFENEITQLVDEYVKESTAISELSPLVVIGLAQAIHDGKFSTGVEAVDEIFDEETIELIKEINVVQDISRIIKIAVKAVELIPVDSETGSFDFEAFSNIDTFFEFDTNLVKDIFNEFGQIDTLTKVLFPVGVGFAVSTFEADITAAGINATELELANIDWGFELANLGNVYEKVVELDLDLNTLFNSNTNSNTGLTYQMEYIISLCSDDEVSPVFKQNLLNLVDTIFDSELLSQIGLVFMKSQIANMELANEDGTPSALNEALELVKENLKQYKVDHLRADLHEIVSSCLDVTTLLPLFMESSGEIYIFDIINELDTESIKHALLGSYNEEANKYEGGIYGLRLLSGDLDGVAGTDTDCYFATDAFIEAVLNTYAVGVIPTESIDSVTTITLENGEKVKLEPTDSRYNFNAWPNELAALIDAISELQTVDGLADISFGESEDALQMIPDSITTTDIDIITNAASRSILLSEIITNLIVSTLESNEMFGETAGDPDILWMDSFDSDGNVTKYGELNSLLKALIIFSDEEKGIDLNDTDSLLNGLAQLIHEADADELNDANKEADLLYGLDYEEVVCLSNSQIIMTLLSGEVSKMGGESSDELALVIPEDLNTENNSENWKNWARDSKGDYKKGEFANLVLVLYYAREYALLDESAVASEETTPALTMGNLLNSVIYMEKDDKVTNSLVLYATISDALMKQHNDTVSDEDTSGSIIFVPEKAKNLNYAEDGIEIIDTEIQKLFVVIRNLEIQLSNNEFDAINLELILEKIEDEAVKESICVSSIFAASTVNKISETDAISIPLEYQKRTSSGVYVVNVEHPVWYPSTDEDASWDECELYKLLSSIGELNLEVRYETVDGVAMEKLDFDQDKLEELIEKLNLDEDGDGLTTLDVVYESAVFRTTISEEILKQEDILYRPQALSNEGFRVRSHTDASESNFSKKEIADLVTFLNETGLEFGSDDGFDTEKIFDSLEDESIRQLITESYILSIIVVDKLTEADGLVIPEKFKTARQADPYKDAWYPVEDNPDTLEDEAVSWDESELGTLLATVVELDVQIDNGTPKFPDDETELLKALNADSETASKDAELSKLDVVYNSDIIKATIKDKLDNNTEILKREDKVYEDTLEQYYYKHEIKLLIEFVNNDGIDFNNFSTAVVFELLDDENNRKVITQSNILNITVVSKFNSTDGLEFPDKFLLVKDNPDTLENEQEINIHELSWYPVNNEKWKDSELAKLLTSVVELDISADSETDLPVLPDSDVLLKSLNDDATTVDGAIRLDVVYASEVIQKTISSKVKQDGIEVRLQAYVKDDEQNVTDILKSIEILQLIDFIEFANIEIHDEGHNVDAEHIFEILESKELVGTKTKGEIARQMIVESNILNITIVSKLADAKDIVFPQLYVITADDPETLTNERVIDIRHDIWYPADDESSSWDECELSKFLNSVIELELEADGNNIHFSSNVIIDSLLEPATTSAHSNDVKLDVVYQSDVIAMSISDRLDKFADIPEYAYKDSSSVFETNEVGSRTLADRIIAEEEIELLMIGLNKLELQFSNNDLNASDVENISLAKLLEADTLTGDKNIDRVLESTILHYIISGQLIDQNQTINSEVNSIVVYNYWTDSSLEAADIEVVKKIGVGNYNEDGVYIYVHDSQIKDAIEVLELMGITRIEEIAQMNNMNKITECFETASSKGIEASQLIDSIAQSAVTSKIFSQIFLSNPLPGTVYDIKPVIEVNDNGSVTALTVNDLKAKLAWLFVAE